MVDQEAEVCLLVQQVQEILHQLVLHKVKMVVEEIEMFHQVQIMLEEEAVLLELPVLMALLVVAAVMVVQE